MAFHAVADDFTRFCIFATSSGPVGLAHFTRALGFINQNAIAVVGEKNGRMYRF